LAKRQSLAMASRRAARRYWPYVIVTAIVSTLATLGLHISKTKISQLSPTTVAEVEQRVSYLSKQEPHIIKAPHESRILIEGDPPEPDNSAFTLLRSEKTWDLRRWRALPPDRSRGEDEGERPLSPVSVQTSYQYQKIKEASEIRLESLTTGYDVYLRLQNCVGKNGEDCTKNTETFKVVGYQSPVALGTDKALRSRQLVVDVSGIPLFAEFNIVTLSTYWNAFQGDSGSWAGANVSDEPSGIYFLLLFPPDRPYSKFTTGVERRGSETKLEAFEARLMHTDKRRSFLYWEIAKPKANHVYSIDWDW